MEADVRVGIGGRGVVWLTRAAVIVPIEQDRVLKRIALQGAQWGVCVCVCVCMCNTYSMYVFF